MTYLGWFVKGFWGCGLLFLGDRIVVPKKLRPDMLQLIHESHQGADKCKTNARTVLYWSGMSQDIETIVGRCHICLKFRASNPKEPFIPHDVSESPWQKVATDITTFNSRDYIFAVDCYSKYPDNMPFASQEFTNFGRDYIKPQLTTVKRTE